MSAVIVIRQPDGGVVVRHPAPGVPAEQAAAGIAAEHRVADEAALPPGEAASRYFRAAWRWGASDAAPVVLDLDAARELQRDRWRAARQPILDRLDALKACALELGDLGRMAAIVTRKAALRDVTKADLSPAADAEALAAAWPPALTDPLP